MRTSIHQKLAQVRPALSAWPYVAGIFATKGLALITLPIITAHVSVSDLGRLEVIATIIELTGLVFALGLAETLFRFAGTAKTPHEERQMAAEITGTGLAFAVIAGLVLQLLAPFIHANLPVEFDLFAVRAGLLAATLSGLIELPLAWMRLKHKPLSFFGFAASRGVALAMCAVVVVRCGGSVEQIILFTAAIDIVISVLLLARQYRQTGVRLSKPALKRGLQFGAPLVGAGLAMFTLGTADRLFLAHHVSPFELGLYAVAAKLALATALIMEPFSLWWGARRFAIFAAKDGAANTANIAGIGFVVLIIGAAGVALAGPLFIEWFLAPAYQHSVVYLQLLVGIAVLNQACTLVSLGIYNRPTGIGVFGVNLVAASIALLGYSVLIPSFGVMGAIAATYIAYGCRFVLFYKVGLRFAPVRYPLFGSGVLGLLAIGLVHSAPHANETLAYLSFGVMSFIILLLSAWLLRLLPVPTGAGAPLLEEGSQQ